ncbi:MAG: zinc ABC transporter substrate-binding protein [Gracilibacteraceae bacterium]|nr:zinc ABC transporter substrate-binding protein [Gracilibacteraceae bacterium]
MKKIWPVVVAICLALFGAVACASPQPAPTPPAGNTNEIESQTEKLSVYASFYPMYDFARKIGGDKAEVVCLTPAGTEPHDWEPAAADIVGLEKAALFVYNGAGMEHWVDDVLAALSNKELVAVEASAGVPLLEGGEEEEDEEEGHEEEGGFDPHVWLNPLYAKIEMANIRDAFVRVDPANSAYYEDNYAQYAAALDELDGEFRSALADPPRREIIVAHQAFGYLCAAYGLVQEPIEGLAADSEPEPARMAEIIAFAEEHAVSVIFFEELVSPKVAETIAAAVGARTEVLSPLEGLSDEQTAAGDDYFSVMRQNLAALLTALQ